MRCRGDTRLMLDVRQKTPRPMKHLILALQLVFALNAFSQDQVNTLIRKGKYEEALSAIKKAEGEDSKKFRELKQWMSHGYRANLKKSDTDVHTSPATNGGSEPAPSKPQDFRITLVSGFPKSWFVVMNKNAYKTEAETYKGPGPWPTEWIRSKWKDGYYISHVAGEKDGWVVVMSKGTGFTNQKYFGPGAFPEKGIGDSAPEGYRITGIAGFQNTWVAVVSKGTPYGHQRFTFPTDFSGKADWIKSRWDDGYRITHLAGDSVKSGKKYVRRRHDQKQWIHSANLQGPNYVS